MMRLHLLGINGPFPESRGATSGYLLEAGDNLFQLDLGSGVLGILTSLSLSALFVSHWHYDHTADIPVLMYRLAACQKALPVYGPADPSSPVYNLVVSTPCFSFTEVSAGQVFELNGTSIHVTAARHPVPAVGYCFSFGGKTFGYTGDTNTLPSLAEDYRGSPGRRPFPCFRLVRGQTPSVRGTGCAPGCGYKSRQPDHHSSESVLAPQNTAAGSPCRIFPYAACRSRCHH